VEHGETQSEAVPILRVVLGARGLFFALRAAAGGLFLRCPCMGVVVLLVLFRLRGCFVVYLM
jgi:hypothetical protein